MKGAAENSVIWVGIMILVVKFALVVAVGMGYLNEVPKYEDAILKVNRNMFRKCRIPEAPVSFGEWFVIQFNIAAGFISSLAKKLCSE